MTLRSMKNRGTKERTKQSVGKRITKELGMKKGRTEPKESQTEEGER